MVVSKGGDLNPVGWTDLIGPNLLAGFSPRCFSHYFFFDITVDLRNSHNSFFVFDLNPILLGGGHFVPAPLNYVVSLSGKSTK